MILRKIVAVNNNLEWKNPSSYPDYSKAQPTSPQVYPSMQQKEELFPWQQISESEQVVPK